MFSEPWLRIYLTEISFTVPPSKRPNSNLIGQLEDLFNNSVATFFFQQRKNLVVLHDPNSLSKMTSDGTLVGSQLFAFESD
jgi:hypothetical protein